MKPKLNSKQIETKSETQTRGKTNKGSKKRNEKATRQVSRLLAAHTKGYSEIHIVAAPPEGLLARFPPEVLPAATFPATRQIARRVVGPLVSP